jgi:NADP-reducing hydrogenase subunit HndB
MNKLKPEDLEKIRLRMKRIINLREGVGRAKVIVHMGDCGIAAGARTVVNTLMEEIEKRDLQDIILIVSDCAGSCSREPMMTIEIANESPVHYFDLTPAKAREILEKHIIGGQTVKEYTV